MRATLMFLVCALGCGDTIDARDGGAIMDGAPDAVFDVPSADNADAPTETATRLLHWNDGVGVRVVSPEGSSDTGYVRGGDFERAIWAADDVLSWATRHPSEDGRLTEDFARATLPVLPGRDNVVAPVLKMELRMNTPGASTSESLSFAEEQPAGRAGEVDASFPSHTLMEPVFYQRQWIKFSPDTRPRAGAIGEDFAQVFWEMRAEPDYRLRVQLSYDDEIGLVVRAHADSLTGAVLIDSGAVPVGTIEMASEELAFGWHRFEVWLDRTRGDESRWRVRFSGFDVLDYTGSLMGESGNVINIAMFAQLHSEEADLSTSSFYQLINDLELWNRPPLDAFQ